MTLIRTPYTFSAGPVTFQDYATILNRINQFPNVTTIGKDSSDTYDQHLITFGRTEVGSYPVIMVQSGIHPPEWQGVQYALKFFEMLRDNAFPDTTFRAKLLSQFTIIWIPVVNPWGMAQMTDPLVGQSPFRYTVNGVDLNRDFYSFTQVESRNVKAIMDSYKPFSFLDIHLYVRSYKAANGKDLIIGNGHNLTDIARMTFAESWGLVADREVHQWDGELMKETSEVARNYASRIDTPYAEKPLAYITEIVRPTHEYPVVGFNDSQIMEVGLASMYIFFKMAMDYFYYKKQWG